MKRSRGKRLKRLVLLFTLCANLIGSGSFAVQAISPGDLLINRVQITGGAGKTDNDFIELYNASPNTIDLNGLRLVKRTKTSYSDTTIKSWTSSLLLHPGAVYLWANSANGFAASLNADVASTQTLSNDNGIAIRSGAEDSGTIIDSVAWGLAQNSFSETTPFPNNPEANQILRRKNYSDTNNNALDFEIFSTLPQPICGNSSIESPEVCDDGNTLNNDGCSSFCQLETPSASCGNGIVEDLEECDDGNTDGTDSCSGTCEQIISTTPVTQEGKAGLFPIYINEFVIDPVAGGSEWIELFSPSDIVYSLTNWTLEDGSGTKTKLQGTIGGNEHYFAIQKSLGALNNDGDIIILRDTSGAIAHTVTYGNWDDGNTSDNAPTAPDPYSIARLPDAQTEKSDKENYGPTSMLTMWGINIIISPPNGNDEEIEDGDEANTVTYDYSKTITLTEISPNPYGPDDAARNDEFIELYNNGEQSVNLTGWRLEIGDHQYIYQFPDSARLGPKTYLIIRAPGNFELANTGSTIKLFQPLRSSAYQSVSYKESQEGQAWDLWQEQNLLSKTWKWTYLATPQQSNIFVSPPLAVFSAPHNLTARETALFDASDTDEAGISSTYLWNFGDGTESSLSSPEHTYSRSGNYTVVLTVKNQYGSSTVSKKIIVSESENAVDRADSDSAEEELLSVALQATTKSNLQSSFKLLINEILPNPEGSDAGQEWVEIINSDTEPINLKGWSISNKSEAGKEIDGDITLEPGEFFVFDAALLPPSLGNSQDTVRLLDDEKRETSSISYTKAPDGKAYAAVKGSWQWTSSPTPGEANIASALAKGTGNSAVNTAKTSLSKSLQNLNGTVIAVPGTFSSQYFYMQATGSPLLYQIYSSKKTFSQA